MIYTVDIIRTLSLSLSLSRTHAPIARTHVHAMLRPADTNQLLRPVKKRGGAKALVPGTSIYQHSQKSVSAYIRYVKPRSQGLLRMCAESAHFGKVGHELGVIGIRGGVFGDEH